MAGDAALAPFAASMMSLAADGRPVLVGGRRVADGRLSYPMPEDADAARYVPVELPRSGRLWSFTVQRFEPKPPYALAAEGPFRPYVVGYVELAGGLIVEARIEGVDPDLLEVGAALALDVLPVRTGDGREGLIPVFRPAAA